MTANIVRTAKRLVRRLVGRPIFGRSILIYHRIAKVDFDPWNIAVTPDEFERQLIQLRSKTVLPLQEFARLHIQKKLPRNAVAITFDDGYACNALVAAPMLESFGYPATFFVVSDAIARSEEFWWDQLEFIFHAPEFDYETADTPLGQRLGEWARRPDRSAGRSRPLADFFALWRILRGLSAEERRQYLDNLRAPWDLRNRTSLDTSAHDGSRNCVRSLPTHYSRSVDTRPLIPPCPRYPQRSRNRRLSLGSRYPGGGP